MIAEGTSEQVGWFVGRKEPAELRLWRQQPLFLVTMLFVTHGVRQRFYLIVGFHARVKIVPKYVLRVQLSCPKGRRA
jgi:hypothetical protein